MKLQLLGKSKTSRIHFRSACVRTMKTWFFLVTLITIGCGRKTKGEEAFECPVKCSTNVYRPICLRGKSYANLCILKQDICKGNIARELYKDVEACPGYEKYEDANGASVEAIDKNGVIFRQLIDAPTKISVSSQTTENPVIKWIGRPTKKRGSRRRDRSRKPLNRKLICRRTCSTRETNRHPVCILGVPGLCGIKFLLGKCYMSKEIVTIKERKFAPIPYRYTFLPQK